MKIIKIESVILKKEHLGSVRHFVEKEIKILIFNLKIFSFSFKEEDKSLN